MRILQDKVYTVEWFCAKTKQKGELCFPSMQACTNFSTLFHKDVIVKITSD